MKCLLLSAVHCGVVIIVCLYSYVFDKVNEFMHDNLSVELRATSNRGVTIIVLEAVKQIRRRHEGATRLPNDVAIDQSFQPLPGPGERAPTSAQWRDGGGERGPGSGVAGGRRGRRGRGRRGAGAARALVQAALRGAARARPLRRLVCQAARPAFVFQDRTILVAFLSLNVTLASCHVIRGLNCKILRFLA